MAEIKRDDGGYVHIDKIQVLQEAKQCFMATSVKTRRLNDVLTRCIFILLRGDKLSNTEATDLFFHITRLFQYKDKDSTLRRLTYIGIKALSKQADNVYVVTSSLTTDVNSSRDDPAVRASALRALCQISDASTFTTIERYLRQCVVDKHPVVASAALTSLIRISRVNNEIVRRCTNEIQEALSSGSPMAQYHALALRYTSCRKDRLAISRLLTTCINNPPYSQLAVCLLLRITTSYIDESTSREELKLYASYIRKCLNNHPSEMVQYEAVKAMVNHIAIFKKDIPALVVHLNVTLSSSRPASRFASVRLLNRLAAVEPEAVRHCNLELERLISQSDCNRSIASLAITTLLKTGTENTVEKFLKQIGGFLSEIDDGFKVAVVSSVEQLCRKYPSKHPVMMDFLFNMLREEGGFKYKEAIVDTIIQIIENNEDTREKGLEILCEFIEDCEHDELAIKTLCLLGREGPRAKNPRCYIRFIENRLKLDTADVSSAAVSALAKFGPVPELTNDIRTLIERATWHEDLGVMEQAIFHKNILCVGKLELVQNPFMNLKPSMNFLDLEMKLSQHLDGACDHPFHISTVAAMPLSDGPNHSNGLDDSSTKLDEGKKKAPAKVFDHIVTPPPSSIFADIDLGALIKSTAPSPLTDSNISEFVVNCIQHIYQRHLVIQFDCTNTVNSMYLENVGIELEAPPGFNILASTEYPQLAFGETISIFACVELLDETCHEMNYFTNIALRFNLKTVNVETEEIDTDMNEEIFPLEDMLIDLSSYASELVI